MNQNKARILCTEDDPDTRELIKLVLEDEGYEVICTDNAAQAIKLAKTQTFDLYLVDNWLPDLCGPTLTARIRAFNSKTPILFYSGAAYDADKESARCAGAQGYLTKPVSNDDLIAEVVRLIADSKIAIPIALELPDDPSVETYFVTDIS
jgi:DNA-binding response OmpR family regulator